MSHTEYSAQFVQYSSVFLGLEEALRVLAGASTQHQRCPILHHRSCGVHECL